ncbi:hypothetical protein GFS31_43890 (plasmid) [Leptolyngbya sp. BL0902]|nr:hypothetical protein GFS31_43890 [Leptolyngbya sp. BL0902]
MDTSSFEMREFQSLRGFGVDWSLWELLKCPAPQSVSIPERVWGGLERRVCTQYSLSVLFQSLRGFGVDWSRR